MPSKDYYKILELSPAATVADIKKSFRRLALLYHPDTNLGSNVYEAKFKEIKEAYEVLSGISQRQEYNRQRKTYQPQQEKKKPYRPPAAETILSQTIELRKKTSALDPARMNTEVLYKQIQHLLAIQNILILKHYNNLTINNRIIDDLIFCAQFLPFPYVEKICLHLTELAGTDNATYSKIYKFSKEARFRSFWNKYKFFVAVIVALILCILIYGLSTTL
jgi:molecular chaperone DnaJ